MQKYSSNKLVLLNKVIPGTITVDKDGKIIMIEEGISSESVKFGDFYLMPGIIDTHNHGTMGFGLTGDIKDKEVELKGYLKGLAAQGVTSVFPTANYLFFETIVKINREEQPYTKIAGIHSEGPYLNRVGEQGVSEKPLEVDLDHIQSMIDKGEGLLKLVAIAPELKQAQKAIDLLNKNNVKVAFAHSNMNYQEACKAFDSGVSVATHTANVMSGIHHRNMGGLGACLLHPEVMCELIPDGLHVSVEMMALMFKAKDYKKWILISDSTAASGAPKGKYKFSKFIINIDEQGFAKTETGRLMGSTKPVIYGMNVLNKKLNVSINDLSMMASSNPAKFYGLDKVGSIEVNKQADFIVVDKDFNLKYTYIDGRKVYDSKETLDLFNPNYLEQI